MAVKQNTKLASQGPKDAQAYLAQLEELLKRNTGTGTHIGADTSSNIPMYIPGRVANPTGLGETPSTMLRGNGMTQPELVERQAPMEYQDQNAGGLSENPTVSEMLQEIFNQAWNPELPSSDQLEEIYQQTGQKYPIASMEDGSIRYNDGSIEQSNDGQPPMPIASMNDGSILWSDGLLRESPPEGLGQYLAGVAGLSQFIFGGQNQTVTQNYGNYNPSLEPGSGINYGTDFRTRDLVQRELYAPVAMRVVQVFKDDGTQWGSLSGHQGYGNSVLVELPSGEMLRLSHLSNMGDYQVGQILNPGDLIGTPGTTGNTAGEHLDVEYYNKDGQIANPNNFKANVSEYSVGNQIVGLSPYIEPFSPQSQAQPTQQPQPIQQPQQEFQNPIREIPQQVVDAHTQPFQQLAEPTANAINQLNPTGQIGIGITETLQGNPEGARQEQANTLESIGTTFRAPELQTNELSNEQGTNPFRQLAGNLLDTASTPLKKVGLPDFGISEAIAGGKTVNTDVRLAPQSGAFEGNQSVQPQPQDYASVLGENVKDAFSQAGEGVKSLGQKGISALEGVFAPKQDESKRAIGDVKGISEEPGQVGQFSSLMDSAASMSSLAKNDVRDPFFKMGGSEMYKDFLKPNAQDLYGGALNLDLFNSDFYKDLGNISSVFGGSKDLGAATEKYIDFEKQKYQPMSRMGYEDGYDRGSIDSYNRAVDEYNNSLNNYFSGIRSSVQGSQSIFTPPPQSSSKNIFASANQSVAPKMSFVPNSVSKPQMSMAKPSAPQMSMSRPSSPQMSMSRPSAPQMSKSRPSTPQMSFAKPQMSKAPQMSVARPAPKPAPKPQMSYAKPQMSYAPRQSIGTQSKPRSNVFSGLGSTIMSIFRR